MELPEKSVRLRIVLGESDRWENKPAYEAIVLRAHQAGMAGATVLRGPMGYGASSHIHTAKILQLSADLPFVVEIVDAPEKIEAFLPLLKPMLGGGVATLEEVRVLHYGAGAKKA